MSRIGKPFYKSDGQYLEKLQTSEPAQVSITSERMDIMLVLEKIIEWQLGDIGRLEHIYDALKQKRQLYKSDEKYLEDILESLYDDPKVGPELELLLLTKPNDALGEYYEKISGSLKKCTKCNNELKFLEETLQHENKWFHAQCAPIIPRLEEIEEKPKQKTEPSIEPQIKKPIEIPVKEQIDVPMEKQIEKPIKITSKDKIKVFDPIQILLASGIFAILIGIAYTMLSSISVIAMAIGAGVAIYQFFTGRNLASSKFEYGKKTPSHFFVTILALPFVLGTILAYDGYAIWESPLRVIILWGLVITFWSTMLFIPVAIYSKYRENLIPEPKVFPPLSVLVPAYNEEKVIAKTLEGLIETNYPHKEIILIDDGSTDNTLKIARRYQEKVKILHKENNGKASALNYGLNFATGEIVVIVDADTIVGRHSLKHLMKGFTLSKDVAAVAGNIKVRNRVNWITKCQALEYIAGIQIVRRAFDLFGAINIVPGALGAFRKSALIEAGTYHKDTLVEDFDATIKVLKSGLIVQGATTATAYTEAPQTIKDFIKQRRRWNRGNIQVVSRHADAISNPRFGNLHKLAFPFMIISMIVLPISGALVIASGIIAILEGDAWFVAQLFALFVMLQYLLTALAIRIDDDDPKLIAHAIFMVIGFKQLMDLLLIRALLEQILQRKASWTSASRIGI